MTSRTKNYSKRLGKSVKGYIVEDYEDLTNYGAECIACGNIFDYRYDYILTEEDEIIIRCPGCGCEQDL